MHETVDGMLEEFEKAGISLPLLPRLYSLVTLTSPLTPTPTAPLTLTLNLTLTLTLTLNLTLTA